MPKTIVFCADGTWNGPDDETEPNSGITNVLKLFLNLEGDLQQGAGAAVEQEKTLLDEHGAPVQIAKYIHGVGDAQNRINRMFNGAVGAGVIKRIVRGYTFLSRNYLAGDDLVIVGFSRGAYTARALAGMVLSQGLLDPASYNDASGDYDQEKAYEMGGKVWYHYRDSAGGGLNPVVLTVKEKAQQANRWLSSFLRSGEAKPQDPTMVRVDRIRAVAVWDTVGAMGLPFRTMSGQSVDVFQFTSKTLSLKVDNGFHAVSLDDPRVDFTPTLWDAGPNVTQTLFAGAHSDVGGGYPVKDNQSDLSDIALEWMADHLRDVGVRLKKPLADPFHPSPLGTAHKPWSWKSPLTWSWVLRARKFKGESVDVDPSIALRRAAAGVKNDIGEADAPYAPDNLP